MNEMRTVTNQQILDEILASRNDVKTIIETSEARLLQKIEELNDKIKILENENLHLKNRCETLDRGNRKNNIVIFGLKIEDQNIEPEFICQQIKALLNVDLVDSDINNVYSLGKTRNSPIKVEFLSYLNKIKVPKNCYKLKGKQISVVQDLTFEQRQENKILRKHLNQLRQNKKEKCYIRKNKLILDGKEYTVQQLNDQKHFDQPSLNNTPRTPTPEQEAHKRQDREVIELGPEALGIRSPKTDGIKKQIKSIPAIKDKL